VDYEPVAVEAKWQRLWREARAFEADADPSRPPYFVNFPYPYMNGLLHLGHTFTLLQLEVAARYHRLLGRNVLWPFAFHCTGTPIVAAAARVADGEPTQIEMLRRGGIPDEQIARMGDPVEWTRYFPKETRLDLDRLGLSVDWRRSFITTELNPYYDAFVRWQFGRLKQLGLVVQGEHPVVWCPKENSPVGDHARIKGEGETPQEFTLLKFPVVDDPEGAMLVAATLRPETVYGQTNLWVDPGLEYERARVDGELWIASRQAFDKLALQRHTVERVGKVRGSELLGRRAVAPAIERPIPVLPSDFCDPDKGTGVVTSVPSDAPDDWMGLTDLRRDPTLASRWGLDPAEVAAIEPVAIISSEGWGPLPAVEICEKMGIRDQHDRDALERAKELVKRDLIEQGRAAVMYEPSGEVVCRCLTPSVVKIVSDQWFIAYGDEGWKARVRDAVARMRFHPEAVRKQFEHVVGWLSDWACTREFGLGTHLPWDDRWVIESLSDSTVYMAYYTVAKHLEHKKLVPADRIDTDFFAHCFEGRGDAAELAGRYGCDAGDLEAARAEFEYWYPFDVRGSGKDLVQNHLTFSIFNHVALFPTDKAPRAFAVNGWLRVGGEKMSKSLGNFLTLRQALDAHGADVVRFTLTLGGEGLDDPNWDPEIADGALKRFASWLEFVGESRGRGRKDRRAIDDWFEAVLSETLATARADYDSFRFRSALKAGYFDLQASLRWYLRRCGGEPNAELLDRTMAVQTQLLSPVVPHLAEEAWQLQGREGLVALSSLPEPGPVSEAARGAIAGEDLLVSTLEDVHRARLEAVGAGGRDRARRGGAPRDGRAHEAGDGARGGAAALQGRARLRAVPHQGHAEARGGRPGEGQGGGRRDGLPLRQRGLPGPRAGMRGRRAGRGRPCHRGPREQGAGRRAWSRGHLRRVTAAAGRRWIPCRARASSACGAGRPVTPRTPRRSAGT
jgi:leucyl-tRNA synthetase